MRQHDQQLAERNVDVCVVTFDAGPMIRAYVEDTGITWPLLLDHDRTLYRGYGMERGSAWNIFGPAAIGIYIRLLLGGRSLQRPGSDVRQLGGDVLIDPQGIVRLHHVGAGPADRPEISTLMRVIEANADGNGSPIDGDPSSPA